MYICALSSAVREVFKEKRKAAATGFGAVSWAVSRIIERTSQVGRGSSKRWMAFTLKL